MHSLYVRSTWNCQILKCHTWSVAGMVGITEKFSDFLYLMASNTMQETMLSWPTMVLSSLVPRPPLFFVFRFSFIIHRSGRAWKTGKAWEHLSREWRPPRVHQMFRVLYWTKTEEQKMGEAWNEARFWALQLFPTCLHLSRCLSLTPNDLELN